MGEGAPADAPLLNVLFLCTGNTGRSILAEAILNRAGAPRVRAWSAGSHPKAAVNPQALALLQGQGFATEGLAPKTWDVFAAPGAPRMDLVITLCDQVAGEACPVWPGQPLRVHWSTPDPSAGGGSATAFDEAYRLLEARIAAFCALPFATMDRAQLADALAALGAAPTGSAG